MFFCDLFLFIKAVYKNVTGLLFVANVKCFGSFGNMH